MDFGLFQEVWKEFLAFMDRVVQWLMYLFGAKKGWPPEEYPNIDEKAENA
jgi:hypothetical protein